MADLPVCPEHLADERFLLLLIEEMEKGYTRESTLKAESWEHICRRMNIEYARGTRVFRVSGLKSYLLCVRERYNFFSALLALDGVQWDMSTNKVKAEDSVWKAYNKAHPDAPRYLNGGEQHFDLMCQIFESGVCFD